MVQIRESEGEFGLIEIALVPPARYDEVAAFYRTVGYGGRLLARDTVVGARDDGGLVGVARLSRECGALVLRGMHVAAGSQRQGIGIRLLEATGNHIGPRDCWCIPYTHLTDFYARIGFIACLPALAPGFIRERFHGYMDRGHEVLIMKREAGG